MISRGPGEILNQVQDDVVRDDVSRHAGLDAASPAVRHAGLDAASPAVRHAGLDAASPAVRHAGLDAASPG